MPADNAVNSVRQNSAQTAPKPFTVISWRPYEKNTLRGFLSLELPSGMVINDLTYHEKGDSSWIGLPGKPFKKDDGSTSYTPVIEIPDKDTSRKFQQAALAALREYLHA